MTCRVRGGSGSDLEGLLELFSFLGLTSPTFAFKSMNPAYFTADCVYLCYMKEWLETNAPTQTPAQPGVVPPSVLGGASPWGVFPPLRSLFAPVSHGFRPGFSLFAVPKRLCPAPPSTSLPASVPAPWRRCASATNRPPIDATAPRNPPPAFFSSPEKFFHLPLPPEGMHDALRAPVVLVGA